MEAGKDGEMEEASPRNLPVFQSREQTKRFCVNPIDVP